ncbi:DMT family transporter [uncultured Herbaspirillum sp.]|jgi:drug/metabolite transporter (DMT)-like permease|uniref:DMT family transporter n=1 Tax=uncultured Herbaspirillum sp. TaxID=160236 RepID=UPI00258A176D|nr:DMT family transporter [uncultured Herbaspirillum sp.]
MSSAVLPHPRIAHSHKLGILFLISGLWTLSLLDTAGKLLALAGYHVVMIAWMRYTINLFFMAATLAPLYRRRHGRSILQSNRLGLQLGRGALLLGSTLIFFSVLKIVPLAEGTAMNFCAPLIVLAISPWLLGERSYVSRWIAVLIGFGGMLIVIRPSGDIPPYGVALGLISALTQALLSILNRKASQADNPMVTLFYGALVGSVASTLMVPFFWTSHTPSMVELAILVSTGITSTIGHFLQNTAYKHAEASVLTPFFYAQIISACGMGWLVFGQFPDSITVLGIAIICASGIGIAYIEHKRAHPLPPADPMESV